MERIRIKDLPHKDRPYEKCLRLGPHSLSDTELLAVILRTGSREGNSLDLADSLLALGSPGDGLLGLLHHSLDDFTAALYRRAVKTHLEAEGQRAFPLFWTS